jgi:hypothetical protein
VKKVKHLVLRSDKLGFAGDDKPFVVKRSLSRIFSIGSGKISLSQERMLSSWIGGSILGSLSVAPNFC